MMRRLLVSFCGIAVISGFIATPTASAQQTVNFFVGAFVPRGLNARGIDDVLVGNNDFLIFNIKDFNGPVVGVGWTVGIADLFDAGIDVGFYQRTSPAIDQDFVHPDRSEIDSQLKLRIVPVTATFRYLPLGHHDAFVPYIGAGVGIFSWRYTESGDFADSNGNISNGTFVGSDTTVGPVILGGARIPIGSKGSGIGGEIRYQRGKGNLPSGRGFAGTTIDLGGFNYLFTINVGF